MGFNPQRQQQVESHRAEHQTEARGVELIDQERADRIQQILDGPDQERADRLRELLAKAAVRSPTN